MPPLSAGTAQARAPAWQQSLYLGLIAAAAAVGAFIGGLVGRRPGDRGAAAESAIRLSVERTAPSLSGALLEPPGGASAPPGEQEDLRILADLRGALGEHMRSRAAARTFFDGLFREIESLRARLQAAQASAASSPAQGDEAALTANLAMAGRALKVARNELCLEPDFVELDEVLELSRLEERIADLHADSAAAATLVGDEPWLQPLFRAEALCHAYYPTGNGWNHLRFGLTAAACAVRGALREKGVFVEYVRLLTPRGGDDDERVPDDRMELQRLARVKRVLRSQLDAPLSGDAFPVVDCLRFGRQRRDRQSRPVRSKVVVYNPAEWS